MERETHKEYIRRLRRERDDSLLQRKEKDLYHRCWTYYIKNPQKGIQPIPHHQIQNYSIVHIQPSYFSVLTPKEQSFLLKRRIHSNIIFADVLKKANYPYEEIQYFYKQNQIIYLQLSQIIY